MNTEIITSLSECKKLWEKFRKDENIWTEWDIVLAFYDEKIHAPHFILLKDGTKEVGLITLWLDKRDNKYTHFGGERMENRSFWVEDKYHSVISEILPPDTYLFDMNEKSVTKALSANPKFEKLIGEKDTRYFLNLEKINKIDEYLERFGKKHKKNLLRDLKILEQTNYKLIWDTRSHADTFMNLSKTRFKDDCDFHDEDNRQEMISFLNHLEKEKMLHSLLIEIDGKIEGAEIAVKYKDKYYVINGGFNANIQNLGKLLIIEHIKKAIELNLGQIDFLVGDSGWKKLWNLDEEECYSVIKKKEN
jgi:hypothetical protein